MHNIKTNQSLTQSLLQNRQYSPSSVSFQYSPFWIRVFNIPIKSMNTTIGNHIAKEIGILLVIDAPKSGLAWGPFLSIQVDIDITKPFMRGKMIHIEEMEDVWVFLSMRGYLHSVIDVVYWVIMSVNVRGLIKGASIRMMMCFNLVLSCELQPQKPIIKKKTPVHIDIVMLKQKILFFLMRKMMQLGVINFVNKH